MYREWQQSVAAAKTAVAPKETGNSVAGGRCASTGLRCCRHRMLVLAATVANGCIAPGVLWALLSEGRAPRLLSG